MKLKTFNDKTMRCSRDHVKKHVHYLLSLLLLINIYLRYFAHGALINKIARVNWLSVRLSTLMN